MWRVNLNMKRIFASAVRIKIMKLLARNGETHIMDLVQKTNSNWIEVNRNINYLERMNFVENLFFKNSRLIRLNEKNDKIQVVLKVLTILDIANLDQLVI